MDHGCSSLNNQFLWSSDPVFLVQVQQFYILRTVNNETIILGTGAAASWVKKQVGQKFANFQQTRLQVFKMSNFASKLGIFSPNFEFWDENFLTIFFTIFRQPKIQEGNCPLPYHDAIAQMHPIKSSLVAQSIISSCLIYHFNDLINVVLTVLTFTCEYNTVC